jgi:hypothetical protein
MFANKGESTPPTILQTAPAIGGSCKRERSHLVDYSDGFGADLDPFDQRTDDFPSRRPVAFVQALVDSLRKILELADHQTQLVFCRSLSRHCPDLGLELVQTLFRVA